MRAADLLLEPVKKYRTSINPPYGRKDLISILGTVFILLAIPLTVFVAVKVRPWGPRAAGTAAAPTTIGSVIEPGSMVSGASYIVFVDGTNYYAKDGKTGEIQFSGTGDAAAVINAAINALPASGGKVLLSEGTFYTAGAIVLKDGVTLQGTGPTSTMIIVQDNRPAGFYIIDLAANNAKDCVLIDFGIRGGVQTVSFSGIRDGATSTNNRFQRLNVQYVKGTSGSYGFYIVGSDEWILQSRIAHNGDGGIWMAGNDCWIFENEIHDHTVADGGQGWGLMLNASNNHVIYNHFYANTIAVYVAPSMRDCSIEGSYIDQSQWSGILVDGSSGYITRLIISNNHFRSGSRAGDNGNDHIQLHAQGGDISHVRIAGNQFTTSDTGDAGPTMNVRYVIYLRKTSGTMTDILVADNDITGTAGTANIKVDSGVEAKVQGNIGYITENSGTATIASGITYVDVSHGLNVTPSAGDILVTATSQLPHGTIVWVSNIGASSFRINVDTAPGAGSSYTFAWKAEVK